ncbi:hypothetical protein DH2020_038047 [Rehmannia glutinosa]|uniref:START domain-containing protein n=1 Tax=Rehmannia glutinosa TaxID=99300 RepID=A0ABR0UZP5_REHGL
MDFSSGGGGSSGGDHHHDGSHPHHRNKRYHRHTAYQIQTLEALAQIERADNCGLRAENDKIRCENIAIREALNNVICPSCGNPPVSEDSYFDEQKLRIQNAHLKEELGRVSSIAAKYIGRPISQLPPMQQPIHVSSLDLSMSNFVATNGNIPGPSNAMNELIRLLQSNDPLWIKSADGRSETLNLESYQRIFQSPYMKNPTTRIEASRDSGVVIMNSLALVDMFMDSNKWVELFPTIVSRAKTIQVISSGMLGSQSGTLQLMYEELQVLSALVPTRQLFFLRLCQQIEEGSWAIVDVSYDIPHDQENRFSSSCIARRLPSGCLIQDMPNGYSKVTWVEHWGVEDKAPIHRLYIDLIHSGLAFGAERWLSTLQRICERFSCLMVTGNSTRDLGGVIPSPEGKRSMMKLAQRMVSNFCSSINPSNGQQWTTLSGTNEFEVRATLHKSTDPGQPNGVWDVLSNQNPVQEVAHIANGSHPGNCISVLRAFNTSQNNMLILQESCIDSSGSLIVYCPVDLPAINIAMSGEDPSYIPLLPSGFTISPDGRQDHHQAGGGDGASTSSNPAISGISSGSLITVVFQILVSNLPSRE